MTNASIAGEPPEPGNAVTVRGRPATVQDVRAHAGNGEACHLVDVEYLDAWEFPAQDTVLWEREADARVLPTTGWPRIGDGIRPDDPQRFAAFCDALRWSSSARLPGLTGDGPALLSPWESAVSPEPYQLYPVLKALEMPRVSLLLADDVGLGKTIEAGLVLRELMNRRRIRRILVICPASLQIQWRDELRSKFSLDFDVLDRAAFTHVQREYGMDANPWAVTPRAIASMDFLRQPDVLEQFRAAAGTLERGHALALDLLIVDEAHNMAPMGFSERSDRTEMLAEVAPHAEHRLFLSATPHNGFTASFSGLLEILDPVRFRQTGDLSEAERKQLDLVMVRRLKSELNDRATELGEVAPFTSRAVAGVPFEWTDAERRLAAALREYRRAGSALLAKLERRQQLVGRFVFSLLTKRLLSSPYALARTWWKHIEGYATTATFDEAAAAANRAERQTADDDEKARREEDLARQGAGWLRRYEAELTAAREDVSAALIALGWDRDVVDEPIDIENVGYSSVFPPDGKWTAFRHWIDTRLRDGDDELLEDERGLIFTEYKDTLDYLTARLRADGMSEPVVRRLFGGSTMMDREIVKDAFTSADDRARLLVATDVAAEGLNLQTACRYVLHYEVPWNPMRLEQRNGRVDRHGQARNVTAFHFTSAADEDVTFIDYVVNKVHQVREDLGSVGEIFDRALDQRFAGAPIDASEVDRRLAITLEHAAQRIDLAVDGDPIATRAGAVAGQVLADTAVAMRLSPDALERLLAQAIALDRGGLEDAGGGTRRLNPPATWARLVDTSLRRRSAGGPIPLLVFDPAALMQASGGRSVFRERPDRVLVRLGHPLMKRATSTLRRCLWEPDSRLRRFTIAAGDIARPTLLVPALLQLTNGLREPLHAELVEIAVALDAPAIQIEVPRWDDCTALEDADLAAWVEHLEDRWDEVVTDLAAMFDAARQAYAKRTEALLPIARKRAITYQRELFAARLRELDADRGEKGRQKLRRDLEREVASLAQMTFDPAEEMEREERARRARDILEGEQYRRIEARRRRLRERVRRERDALLDDVLPRRYTLARSTLTPAAVALLVPFGTRP